MAPPKPSKKQYWGKRKGNSFKSDRASDMAKEESSSNRQQENVISGYTAVDRTVLSNTFASRCQHWGFKPKWTYDKATSNEWYAKVQIEDLWYESDHPMPDIQNAKAAAIEVATEHVWKLSLPVNSTRPFTDYVTLLRSYAKCKNQNPPSIKGTKYTVLVDDDSKLITIEGSEVEKTLHRIEVIIDERPLQPFVAEGFTAREEASQSANEQALEWLRSQGKLASDPILQHDPVLESHYYSALEMHWIEGAQKQAENNSK